MTRNQTFTDRQRCESMLAPATGKQSPKPKISQHCLESAVFVSLRLMSDGVTLIFHHQRAFVCESPDVPV